MIRDLLNIIYIFIYLFIFFYFYRLILIDYSYLYSFTPEFIFIYGFISIFIYSFSKKMTSFDCFWSYVILMIITINQYIKILKCNNFVNIEHWYTSALSINIKIVVLLTVFIVLFFIYMLEDKDSEIFLNFELLSLILLCVLGIIIFISSNNLFVLYLGIELQSLALYILCCLKRYSNKSVEAGLKYFIFGSYASLVLLLGVSFLYLVFGTLNLNDLNLLISTTNLNDNIFLNVGLICILIGFFFKLAVCPFHWWLSDVFEGSSDVITFFLATVPKLPFFFVLYRLDIFLYVNYVYYSFLLITCSLLSIIVGTILALYTVKLKKLFAYSSIVHMGYMLLALGLSSKIGAAISFYYFLIYLLSTINIFSIYLLIKNSHGIIFGNITDLSYLKNSNKLLSLIAIVSLLSLAGIPPFMGFYGKLFIFNLLISTGNYIICLILLLLSILSCVYYIRLVRFIFFDDRTEEPIVFQKVKSPYIYISITFFFLLNIVFLFFQEPILVHIIYLFS